VLYAKVVLGLAVQGPFDYIIPETFIKKIKVGTRVWVNFRTQRMVGYVVKVTTKTKIKNLKAILEVIDDSAVLDKNMLLLTRELSDYYCCSWGEAIEAALPQGLRKGKKISYTKEIKYPKQEGSKEITLIHDLDGHTRWDIYLSHIKDTLDNNKTVIVLLSDINSVLRAREIIRDRIPCSLATLYRKQSRELEEWLKIKTGEINIVVGTRSSIFAPLNNLGLVIIDEEEEPVYKQDQVPHYNAREVAFMRINIEKAKLILGSTSPSLETFYLTRKNKINPSTSLRVDAERSRSIKYILIPPKFFPEIKVVDTSYEHYNLKQRNILSSYLTDAIISSLNRRGKILLFLNRRGFATFASCRHCNIILKCPRCNINLVYHFKDNILSCHYCNFKMQPPQICPNCNSGYIRYSGLGIEKIESELSRLFPQARVKRLDNYQDAAIDDADILVSTKSIIKRTNYNFDLIGVLSIDNSLNRVDLRASEKTFSLLVSLLGLTKEKLIIQTNLPRHHCFQALENKDIQMFYDEELRQRKQLNFPPHSHLGLVKLRGEKEAKVKEVSNVLFKKLNKYNKNKNIRIISVSPSQPSKLRGKFYWQILIQSSDVKKISRFLKIYLKKFSHSGIIVTVDIDPL